MSERSINQKVGAKGHKWVMSVIEDHPLWLSRDLSEDYGIDAEAELTEDGVRGWILKLQFKTSETVPRSDGKVRMSIDKRYIEYARSCRYPVVLVQIDISRREAWYLWIQDWLLQERRRGRILEPSQSNYTVWVNERQTLAHGLDHELQHIARWEGESQLVLSLLDAMRAAAATYNTDVVALVLQLIDSVAPSTTEASFDLILEEAMELGSRLRGTARGLVVSDQLFSLIRKFGDRMSRTAVEKMGCRGDAFSRTGLTGLAILYDEFFSHTRDLELPAFFLSKELPQIAYYCALREHAPERKDLSYMCGPGDFTYAGLKFDPEALDWLPDKYANRGPSAITDYLIWDGTLMN